MKGIQPLKLKYEDFVNLTERRILDSGSEISVEAIPAMDRTANDKTIQVTIEGLKSAQSGRYRTFTIGIYDNRKSVKERYSVAIYNEFPIFTAKYYGKFDDISKAIPIFDDMLEKVFECVNVDDEQATFDALKNIDKGETVSDEVNHPSHYTSGGIECIQAIEAVLGKSGTIDYCTGNAIKYLWRWRTKGGTTDLRKASWYIDFILKTIEGVNE